MKIIVESSAYLMIMALICLVSIDFILMNMNISKINEVEQYIEDYIEIYGEQQDDKALDMISLENAKRFAAENSCDFTCEYEAETTQYAYYRIHVTYSLKSKIFRIQKTHVYDGLVRVQLERDENT